MNKYTVSTVAAIAIIILGFTIESSAQAVERARVDIPFDFYVGDERLAGGTYEFESTNRQAYPGALIVRSTDRTNGRSVIVLALAGEPARGAGDLAIRFNRYGSVHYLSGISFVAGDHALRLRACREEKMLARKSQQPVPVLLRTTTATGN
jgi:hypothetical protein